VTCVFHSPYGGAIYSGNIGDQFGVEFEATSDLEIICEFKVGPMAKFLNCN